MIIEEAIKQSFVGSDISFRKLYYLMHNVMPNELEYSFGSDRTLNLSSLLKEDLQKAYPTAIIFRRDSTSEDPAKSEDTIFNIFGDHAFIAIIDDANYYLISPYLITILYSNDDGNILLGNLLKLVKPENILPKKATVSLVAFNGGDYYTLDSEIERTNIDIEKNYNDDFKPTHENIVNFLEKKESGVILLHGTRGAGKSYYIRHLISNYPGKYLFITQALVSKLGEPDFMEFLLSNKNAIFILEDCDQVLKDRSMNYFSNALTSILNMSDGILSDIFNYKFICTFNDDIIGVDKALLRPGRCYVDYEFSNLSAEKTKKLLKDRGITVENCSPMSLAEIYTFSQDTVVKNNKKRIGF